MASQTKTARPKKRDRPECGAIGAITGTPCKRRVWPGPRCAQHAHLDTLASTKAPTNRKRPVGRYVETMLERVWDAFEELEARRADPNDALSDEQWYVGLAQYAEQIRKLDGTVSLKKANLAKAGLDDTTAANLRRGNEAVLFALSGAKDAARKRLAKRPDGLLDDFVTQKGGDT